MTILEAIVLGVLQGITEFIPVSSSGHLVLMQHFLGIKESQVFFDVMLHFGTLGAVIIVYYQSIGALVRTGFSTLFQTDFYRHPQLRIASTPDLRLIWFLLLGSIPTGLIALLFKDSFEAIFGKPMVVAGMLIITGLILQLSRLGQRRHQTETPLQAWHTPLVGIVPRACHHPRNFQIRINDFYLAIVGPVSTGCSAILFSTFDSCNLGGRWPSSSKM